MPRKFIFNVFMTNLISSMLQNQLSASTYLALKPCLKALLSISIAHSGLDFLYSSTRSVFFLSFLEC